MDATRRALETIKRAIFQYDNEFGDPSPVNTWIVFPASGRHAGLDCRHVSKIMAEILALPISADMSRPAPVCGEIG